MVTGIHKINLLNAFNLPSQTQKQDGGYINPQSMWNVGLDC